MAADLNRVTLVGRLTKDPEVRATAGGTSVCSIRLAVTTRTNRGGEWSDQSNYFDVTAFGRTADNAGQYLTKGRRIGVDGRLSWREWQTQDGTKRQAVEVIANDVFFLDSGQREEGGAPSNDMGAPLPWPAGGSVAAPGDEDDSIPFAASRV